MRYGQHASAHPAVLISSAHEVFALALAHDAVSAALHAAEQPPAASQQVLHGLAATAYAVHADASDGHVAVQTADGSQIAEPWKVPPPLSQVVWSTTIEQTGKMTTPSQQPPGEPGGVTQFPDASHTAPPPIVVPPASLRHAIADGALEHPVAKSQHRPPVPAGGHAAGARQSFTFVRCSGFPFCSPPFGHSPQ